MSEKEHHQHLSGFAQEVKGKTGLKRIINATKYSLDGLQSAFKHESAFRQLTVLHTLLLIALFFLPFSLVIKMILFFASFFSMVVELFNTGLEASIDHTSTEKHPLAKIGKDVGSSAQFLTLWLLVGLWVMAFSSL